MSEFKIGDRVKLLGTKTNVGNSWERFVETTTNKKGDIGIIEKIDEVGDISVKIKGKSYWFKPADLIKFGSKGVEKVTHIIIYDKKDKDPHVLCYGKDDMKEDVTRLLKDSDVKHETLQVYEITKKLRQPKLKVQF